MEIGSTTFNVGGAKGGLVIGFGYVRIETVSSPYQSPSGTMAITSE